MKGLSGGHNILLIAYQVFWARIIFQYPGIFFVKNEYSALIDS